MALKAAPAEGPPRTRTGRGLNRAGATPTSPICQARPSPLRRRRARNSTPSATAHSSSTASRLATAAACSLSRRRPWLGDALSIPRLHQHQARQRPATVGTTLKPPRRWGNTGTAGPAAPRLLRSVPPLMATLIPAECASSSSGAEDDRKEEHHDVTERQAHGNQPVGVRSGETPGSPVARPPASGEIAGSRRGAVQLASPQHQAKPAASLGIPAQADQEGAEPAFQWRRPWTAPGSLERVPRNPPA
jgi:hypothetical protein